MGFRSDSPPPSRRRTLRRVPRPSPVGIADSPKSKDKKANAEALRTQRSAQTSLRISAKPSQSRQKISRDNRMTTWLIRLRALACSRLGALQEHIEGGTVVNVAGGDDGRDLAGVVDVGERIGVEEDEVGEFAFCDRTLGGFGTEEFGGVARGGLQRFHRSKASLDEIGEFVVEAESGENEDGGGSVGAGQEWNSGVVHIGDHFQIARKVFLAEWEWIFLQVGNHLVVETLPGDIAPVGRDIFGERVVRQVALIEKSAAALPDQRWALPRLRFGEQRQKLATFFRIGGAEQKLRVALAVDEFLLFAGAALEAAHQVLNAFLAGGDGFGDADFVGDMANEGKIFFVGFGGGGQIGIVRDDGLHLDEVGALRLELIDGGAGSIWRRCRDRAGKAEFAARQNGVEHRAADDHAGTWNFSGGDLFAPVEEDW